MRNFTVLGLFALVEAILVLSCCLMYCKGTTALSCNGREAVDAADTKRRPYAVGTEVPEREYILIRSYGYRWRQGLAHFLFFAEALA